jgi:hypothetical protein
MPEPKKKVTSPDVPDAKPVTPDGPGNLSIESKPPEITLTGPVGIYLDGKHGNRLTVGIFGKTLDASASVVQVGAGVKTRTFFSDGKLHVELESGEWDSTPCKVSFNLKF